MKRDGEFGMFAKKYFSADGVMMPQPVIGQVYEYIPVAFNATGTEDTPTEHPVGVFRGFSAFGPALFLPVKN